MALEKSARSDPGPGGLLAELDPVFARFAQEVRRCAGFARWIPLISPGAMRSAYEEADVVLNASFSEGLSNAILEGMAAGRPLLASDIPGNRGPVLGEKGDDPSGILFNPQDPEDFLKQALRLIDDQELRESLGLTAKRRAATWPGSMDEAEGLIRAYAFARKPS
jgi:glycosyltransferase involved in cell wall biosynthesis